MSFLEILYVPFPSLIFHLVAMLWLLAYDILIQWSLRLYNFRIHVTGFVSLTDCNHTVF